MLKAGCMYSPSRPKEAGDVEKTLVSGLIAALAGKTLIVSSGET